MKTQITWMATLFLVLGMSAMASAESKIRLTRYFEDSEEAAAAEDAEAPADESDDDSDTTAPPAASVDYSSIGSGCASCGGVGCTTCCDSGSGGCCDSFCGTPSCCSNRLFGVFLPSDHCACDFISPMTNPVFFEDPRTLTEVRAIFVNHMIPPALSAGPGSDHVRVIAAQVRAALTERLSIIAAKDGFIMSDSPLIEDGWADVSIGLKYNLYADYCTGTLLSAGVAYEMPVGSRRALQGNGDGEWHAFVSGGQRIGCNGHWISGFGYRFPSDTFDESSMLYWSNHFDVKLTQRIYALAEVNWYHWTDGGAVGPAGIEGGDFFNFGSPGVAGNDIVTGAFGVKYKPSCNLELGVAWEAPLTDRRDVLDNRLTVDAIFRY